MDSHQLDIAVRDGDASWCSCRCGWVSPKSSEDEVRGLLAAHVVELAFISTATA